MLEENTIEVAAMKAGGWKAMNAGSGDEDSVRKVPGEGMVVVRAEGGVYVVVVVVGKGEGEGGWLSK